MEEPNLPFGGDDGTNGYAPIALVVGTTLRWVHGNHLGVPQVHTGNTGIKFAPHFAETPKESLRRMLPGL